ncbi:hypothetical protein LCGC14_0365340 [marine sediment metagenome]|uniref:Uncharacterized protein n=1 Tax=marine sediment metagenome TaxID=412755 RepID=A0A0F9WF33_9ZZZZ
MKKDRSIRQAQDNPLGNAQGKCDACSKPADLITYREHKVCGSCLGWWKFYEKHFERTIEFEEYLRGIRYVDPETDAKKQAKLDRDRAIVKLRKEGKIITKIATECKVSRTTVQNVLRGK